MSTASLETSVSTAPAAASPRRGRWIISPAWDLVFLIAAPVAIVPLVSLAATRWLDVEEISLLVISFASLGHHLPGFLRAYGDRQLFSRFRQRFLLAPPAVFAVALLATALGLHGLALILLFWATWHGLMQTYGFMRIYDLKQGVGDRHGARFDFLLCLAIFLAGLVFSDARVYGIADTIAKSGLPVPSPGWLAALRWVVGGGTVLAIAAYVAHLASRAWRKVPLAWPRIALGLSTGWLYWIGGVLATDMLIGVATFEIFHALQYNAIVWAYNRGRARKPDALARPLGALFQGNRWTVLAVYVALIAAFSSLRLLGEAGSDSWAHRALMALLTTSTFMHFYFDGFIWKVSDRQTQADLAIAERSMGAAGPPRRRISHPVLWIGGAALAAGLLIGEWMPRAGSATEGPDSLARLAALTPGLPELEWRLSDDAIARGDTKMAVDAAANAVLLRPHSQQAHARLGAALLVDERFADAAAAFRKAGELGPRRWENHCNLGIALSRLDRWDEAEQAFERAAQLDARNPNIQAAWGRMCERRHHDAAAIAHYRSALASDPSDAVVRAALVPLVSRSGAHEEAIRLGLGGAELHADAAAHLCLGRALSAAARYEEAAAALGQACDLLAEPRGSAKSVSESTSTPEPISGDATGGLAAAAGYELAVAQLQLGRLAEAEQNLARVLKLDPQSSLANFQLGNVQQAAGNPAVAIQSYRRSLDLQPDFAPAYVNLATVLLLAGDTGHARKAYERALAVAPNDASAHYNLGLLLLGTQELAAARQHLLRARELGIAIAPELGAQLKLSQ